MPPWGWFPVWGEDRFLPDQPITRAEFVTMAMGVCTPGVQSRQLLPRCTPGDWYYEAVLSAADYGWISGYPDGSFCPQRLVTRGEMSVMVNRMLGRKADPDFISGHTGLYTFLDVPAFHWAYDDICEAANAHRHTQSDREGGLGRPAGINKIHSVVWTTCNPIPKD